MRHSATVIAVVESRCRWLRLPGRGDWIIQVSLLALTVMLAGCRGPESVRRPWAEAISPTIPVAVRTPSPSTTEVQQVEVALTETSIEIAWPITGGPTVLVVANVATMERVFAIVGPNGETTTEERLLPGEVRGIAMTPEPGVQLVSSDPSTGAEIRVTLDPADSQ